MAAEIILETNVVGLPLLRRGKVRDVYDAGEHLLIVATDRVSAFDVVLPDGIPGKGRALTRISLFWFDTLSDVGPNHLVSAALGDFPPECRPYWDILSRRSMLVKKAEPFPVECIVRGYLAGSGWAEYQASGSVCGIPLPSGLTQSQELPEPLFTPSTKAPAGEHDENISFREMEGIVGSEWAASLRKASLELYAAAREVARRRGFLLADTKLEFGLHKGEMMLIDEAFTPDSSRFWMAGAYRPGQPQDSYDKQLIRDYLKSIGWSRTPPAPRLPPEIVRLTARRYQEICEALAGREFTVSP
jgi:phosphoribosylaminoimidazole-succinocarboxamide synthase